MARIVEFFRTSDVARPHPTTVECGYQVVQSPTGPLLQLSTYGSDDRPQKKVSQTIQVDAERAQELRRILDEVFPTRAR